MEGCLGWDDETLIRLEAFAGADVKRGAPLAAGAELGRGSLEELGRDKLRAAPPREARGGLSDAKYVSMVGKPIHQDMIT